MSDPAWSQLDEADRLLFTAMVQVDRAITPTERKEP